ncbi:MAG: hypothetical protein HY904_13110 [Deltaproteobacteria bacterium]|nr:hypothetical protein [Deltaproteobacteria bacterium]
MKTQARALALGLLSSTVALAQPVLGPPTPVTPAVSLEGQAQARAVGTRDGFFVVWQAGVGRTAKVRGARLGLDGVSLDAAGLTLAEGAGGRFEPAVAFGHGVYFVAWSDLRDGHHAVYGARVSPDGTVLDPGGILLTTDPGARMADVAATPAGFLLAWAQTTADGQGTEARARRLGPDGTPLTPPVALTTAPPWGAGEDFGHSALARAYCQQVRVAVDGTVAFVAWMGNLGHSQDIRIGRAVVNTETGALVGAVDYAIPQTQSRVADPALARLTDGGLFISWTDHRGRGELGLPEHNAILLPAWPADGDLTRVSLREDGGAREVLRPVAASAGVVAFVQGVENPQRQRRKEWRVRVRVVEAGGSPGPDVTVPGEAAWPAVVTGPTGVTLLVTTTVNTGGADAGRLMGRLVSR